MAIIWDDRGMHDWPPYFVDGHWDGAAVRRRQEELAFSRLPWSPPRIQIGIVPVEFEPATTIPKRRHPCVGGGIGDRLSFADYYGRRLTTGSAP